MNDTTATQLACKDKSSLQQLPISAEPTLIPYFHLYHDRIVLASRLECLFKKHVVQEASLSNLKKQKFTGKLSIAQKSRIRRILTAWFSSLRNSDYFQDKKGVMRKRNPVFVTLTLPSTQLHTDEVIKRELLNHFIIKLQRETNVVHYFWRAESQVNGNIHFHLLIDAFVAYSQLQGMWNLVLDKLNYVSDFENAHGHRNPNSVDVRKPKNQADIIEYVIKYASKDEENRLVAGRIWGMSDSLRNLKVYSSLMCHSLEAKLVAAIEAKQIIVYSKEFFTVLIFKQEFRSTPLYSSLISSSYSYYHDLFVKLYCAPPPEHFVNITDTPEPIDFLQTVIDFSY